MKKVLIMLILSLFLLTSCDLVDKLRDLYFGENVSVYENDGDYTNDSLKANGPFTTSAMPSTGDVNVLVVPVNFDSRNKTNTIKNKIDKAFNGTSDDTGWESVSSYYYKSSYGKLNLSFELTDWYTPIESDEFYINYEDPYEDGVTYLLREVLESFDNKYDYSKYDSDSDGFIDSVWLVYNKKYDNDSEFWWAYSFFNQTNDLYDGKKARYYAFASYDFMNDGDLLINPITFIHETGHLLGLDDYYDYNAKYLHGGLYGLDMMDMNVGDHASISKILLGWVTPIVINESGTYDIDCFSDSGDVLLIANHELKTIYDEYILLDYYMDTGLDSYSDPYGSGSQGIRVYHVDARLNLDKYDNLSFNGGDYQTGFLMDNTDGDDYFVELLRACTSSRNALAPSYYPKYLFNSNSKIFGKEIYSNYRLHDGKLINFTMSVSITGSTASINIEFK